MALASGRDIPPTTCLAIKYLALRPAWIANACRSLGDTANTEGRVLAGTGPCWTGFCIFGLTMSHEPIRSIKSPSCAISAKKNFGSTYVAQTISDATTS